MQKQVEDLIVWQKSIKLVKDIYLVTRGFPDEEKYGLSSQIRRAAVSIPSNISEGKGRCHKREYVQFLYVAKASAFEMLTHLRIAKDLAYMNDEEFKDLDGRCDEVIAMLNGLIDFAK